VGKLLLFEKWLESDMTIASSNLNDWGKKGDVGWGGACYPFRNRPVASTVCLVVLRLLGEKMGINTLKIKNNLLSLDTDGTQGEDSSSHFFRILVGTELETSPVQASENTQRIIRISDISHSLHIL
jgi:hypothetical protein